MSIEHPQLEACSPNACFVGRIMRIERKISAVFREKVAPYGLTNSQLSMLFTIAKAGPITQQTMADKMIMEKSSVSRNLSRLLESAYVEKDKSRRLVITVEGKDLLEKVVPAWDEAMLDMKNLLGPEGQKAFDLLFERIIKS